MRLGRLTIIALAAALFGCSRGHERTEIDLQRFFGECGAVYGGLTDLAKAEGECGIVTTLINRFNAENSDVKVVVNVVAWPGYAQLAAQMAAGDPPDLVTMHQSVISDYQVRGLLEPMNSALAEAGLHPEDFTAASRRGVTRDGQLYGLPWDTIGGLFHINTGLFEGGPEPIVFRNKYTDWLPNANMRIQFSPEWQLRLAATQTRTRPTFQQLNPGLRLSQPTGCSPGASDCVRFGTGGNPLLTPLDSNNYDISLEYYFSRQGFASLAGFRRDMKGFITNRAFQLPEPDPETGLPLLITGPVNTNTARIQGIEAQVSTFFDFGFVPSWARAFGVQANATYIDAKARFNIFPETDPAPGQQSLNEAFFRARIPDVSKWTYNLVGMYEAGGLTARLAMNRRTGYPEGALAERDGFFTLQGRAHSRTRFDWSSSYTINEHLTVFFDWLDIFNKPFKSDIVRVNWPAGNPSAPEVFPMLVRYEESLLSGGIRFRF